MRTVFVAAGHSATDPGAVSADGLLKEAELALQLRDAVVAALIADHVPVKADGSQGQNKPLRDSIALAKACDGPRIEIHFNAGPPTAKGVEVLSLPAHKALAQKLASAITKHTGSPLRGVLGWKDQGSGQHHRLGFCLDANGLIVEVEFISNPQAMAEYTLKRQDIAASIAAVLAAEAME